MVHQDEEQRSNEIEKGETSKFIPDGNITSCPVFTEIEVIAAGLQSFLPSAASFRMDCLVMLPS
jgi:hypothetical protein